MLLRTTSVNDDTAEWIFRVLKQIIKITYYQGRLPSSLDYLKKFMKFIPKVRKAYAEESLSRMLSNYSKSNDLDFVLKMNEIILQGLDTCDLSKLAVERLWFRIKIITLNIMNEKHSESQCDELILELNSALEHCSDYCKNSFSLEVISAQIVYYSLRPVVDIKKLTDLYRRSLSVPSTVTHPKIMGIVRDCCARVQFYRGNFEKARLSFYECFKNFDETGSPLKKQALKRFIWCGIITESEMNPFESQETQIYSEFDEFSDLINVMNSYEHLDLDGVLNAINRMHERRDMLMTDSTFRSSESIIITNLRIRIIKNLLKAYSRIKFETIMRKIKLSEKELENVLIRMISKGELSDVKVDFADRLIINVPESTISNDFLMTLSAKDLLTNFKSLYVIGFNVEQPTQFDESNVDSMDLCQQETSSIHSDSLRKSTSRNNLTQAENCLLNRYVMMNDIYDKNKQQLSRAVQKWLDSLRSTIPEVSKVELSQKDQVINAQKNENQISLYAEKNEKMGTHLSKSTNAMNDMNVMGARINYDALRERKESVEQWYKELYRYQLGYSADSNSPELESRGN